MPTSHTRKASRDAHPLLYLLPHQYLTMAPSTQHSSSFAVDNARLLSDPTSAIWEATLQLSERAHALRKSAAGTKVSAGEFRGTVDKIDSRGTVSLRGDDGETKTVALNPKRAHHVLEAVATTRRK